MSINFFFFLNYQILSYEKNNKLTMLKSTRKMANSRSILDQNKTKLLIFSWNYVLGMHHSLVHKQNLNYTTKIIKFLIK